MQIFFAQSRVSMETENKGNEIQWIDELLIGVKKAMSWGANSHLHYMERENVVDNMFRYPKQLNCWPSSHDGI